MRLTLRTLLAYLDDTLDASEIKDFGQKVAESDAAQELVARIKQVTRRRRLTVPTTTGPEATDPNDVAEYLDNELASDRVSELEKQALESDVHLAEIAACHQILTLVLGEPALVPPKSKERMYGLVQGREAIPYRKAQQPRKTTATSLGDEEPLALSAGWLRWVLPAAGLLLVVALGLAIYQVLPNTRSKDRQASRDRQTKIEDEGKGDVEPKGTGNGTPDKDRGKNGEIEKGKGSDKDKGKDKPGIDPPEKLPADTETKPPVNPAVVERAAPPSKERKQVGLYSGGLTDLPSALVFQPEGKGDWARVSAGNRVFSSDTLVTLPGFTSVLRTNTGVAVMMRGLVREFAVSLIMHYLMDSAIVLHDNPKFDLDLTLLRGRIYLSNRKDKGPCKIRLRFESEVWDVTLGGPGDEIAVDLTRSYTPLINARAGEEPQAQCFVALTTGDAEFKIDAYHTYNVEVEPPRWARMEWDSNTRSRGPFREDKLPPSWNKRPPSPDLVPERREPLKRVQAALKDLEALFGSGKSVLVALKESLDKTDVASRMLAIYCLASIDAVGQVVDVLGDEDPAHWPDREAAFYSLQRWISRSSKNGRLLYDEKAGTGLLLDKKWKKKEAETLVHMLYPLQADELGKVETYDLLARGLQHRRVAVAEACFWNLVYLSPGVKLPTGFNAASPLEDRERYAAQIQAMIEKKVLPPAPPAPPEK